MTRQQVGAAVEAEGLTKTYRSRGGTVEAVRGVDLRVGAGEVFGFLGPNGAGKSTTVRMLTTLLSITAGTARVGGTDVAAEPDAARQRMGVALQEAGLDPRQTGRELLVLQARLFGRSRAEAAERAQALLELVELTDAARRRVGAYSMGMRQRLALAAALLGDPATLVLDEPANGLDPRGIAWLRSLLRRLADEGRTVLVSSHQLAELAQTVDVVVVIVRGRLVARGSTDELIATHSATSLEDLYLRLVTAQESS